MLLAEYSEISEFFKQVKKSDIGILLDLGHTAVTATWLKFDKNEFVKKCANKVSAIHISNNNGYQDQHASLTKNCWQISQIKAFKKLPIILETMNLTIEKIKLNIKLVKKFLS